jgi:hypothetical protein
MDNIIIVREAAANFGYIIVGETEHCDMTQREFLAAQNVTGAKIVRNEVIRDGREVRFWVEVNP